MFLKEYWFRELYLGLKVTASFDRSESYTRVIDGQVRCITTEIKPQNYRSSGTCSFSLSVITIRPVGRQPTTQNRPSNYHNSPVCLRMDDPPVYHSLRRESIKNASSASEIGVQSVRPTWFEDFAVSKGAAPQTDQGQPNRCMVSNWLLKKRRCR